MNPEHFPPSHAWARMEGLGNDFIVVLAPEPDTPVPDADAARTLCDRHRGIGGDGLLWLSMDYDGTPRMTVLNADGSRPGMCGNGLRCAARYLADRGLAPRDRTFGIRTDSGTREVRMLDGDHIEALLDVPAFAPEDLPARPAQAHRSHSGDHGTTRMALDPEDPPGMLVSMGNPHLVLLDDTFDRSRFKDLGHRAQTHPALPEGVNLGWARLSGADTLDLDVWERGVGPTQACGTGAAAAAVTASLAVGKPGAWHVRQPGGTLLCRWDGPGTPVVQVGPARWIATGNWPTISR